MDPPNRDEPDTQDDIGTLEGSRTCVRVTDLGNGSVRVQLDLALPWPEAARLLAAIPANGGDR
jgi:hypothetical protein